MIRLTRNASVWMRLARRWATVGSVSATSVSASSPRAPIGVFSSWLTLATKSRRISSRRRRSETSSITAITPRVRRPSSMSWVARPGCAGAARRGRASCRPRPVFQASARSSTTACRRQGVTVATTHEADGARVAEHDLPVLVADDDPLGERVEGAPQTDGVGRRLGHGLGGAIGDLLEVVERRLDPRRGPPAGSRRRGGRPGPTAAARATAARPPTKRGGQRDCHQGQRPETDEPGDGDGVGDPPGRADHRSPVHRSPAWQARTCTRRPGPVPHHAVVGSRGARRPTPPGSDAARWLKHEKS